MAACWKTIIPERIAKVHSGPESGGVSAQPNGLCIQWLVQCQLPKMLLKFRLRSPKCVCYKATGPVIQGSPGKEACTESKATVAGLLYRTIYIKLQGMK